MSYLIGIAAAAALVWLPVLLVRLPLALGCVVYLVLVNCASLELLAFDVGPIHMTLDRFFLIGLAAATIVQRWTGAARPRRLGAGDWCLLAFLAMLVLSAAGHDWSDARLASAPVVQHLINGYLAPALLFWIARQSRPTPGQLAAAYAILVAFGAYLAVTGLCEAAGWWSFVFPKYIADPAVGIHFGRARGPMVHAVTFGATLTICTLAGWALWPRLRRGWQLLLLAALPLAAAAVFFSFTRSAWLGAAVGWSVAVLLTFPPRWRGWALGGAVAAGLLAMLLNSERLLAFNRVDNSAVETRESVNLRGVFTYVSWKMFQDRPLFGVGFGQFPIAKYSYLADRETPFELEAIRPYVHHNTLLSILTEVGAVGLALFLAVLACWAAAAGRLWRTAHAPPIVRSHGMLLLAALGVYLCQAAFHEMSFGPRDHALLFMLAGLAAALEGGTAAPKPPPPALSDGGEG